MDIQSKPYLVFPTVPFALSAKWSRAAVEVGPWGIVKPSVYRLNMDVYDPEAATIALPELRAFWSDLGDFLRAADALLQQESAPKGD